MMIFTTLGNEGSTMLGHRSILAFLVSASLAWLGTPSLAADPVLADSIVSGTVGIQTKQVDTDQFFLALEIQVDDVVAVVVTTPGESMPLLRIELEEYADQVETAIGPRQALTLVSLTADELKGRLQHLLSYDGRKLEALFVSLVTSSGDVVPLKIRSRGFAAGQEHEIEFRGRCITATLICTRPDGSSCNTSQQCCSGGVDYCVDCGRCSITCPPCSLLPP